MAAVNMPLGELDFFPPSDRELALRAQIKTGWSTVALRKELKMADTYLPKSELRSIQDVLTRAEAFNRVEEIRIGVQTLKFKQLKEGVRGNGTTSCLLCGFDFANQRTRRPVSLQFCDECDKAMCPRCRVQERVTPSGALAHLCRICYEERELWKKSGAWLSNHLPVISIPEEELIRFQQLKNTDKKVTLGRRDSAPKEFINPYQLEAEDSDDDDEDFGSSRSGGSQMHIPSSREGSPIPSAFSLVDSGKTRSLPRDSSLPRDGRLHPQLKSVGGSLDQHPPSDEPRKRAGTFSGDLEESVLIRKRAMGGAARKRLSSSRRRIREKRSVMLSHDSSLDHDVQQPQPAENVGERETGGNVEQQEEILSPLSDQQFPAVPTIRLRRPSGPPKSLTTKQRASMTDGHPAAAAVAEPKSPLDRSESKDTFTESTTSESETHEIKKVHQRRKTESETDDSIIPVGSFDVPAAAAVDHSTSTPTKRKPVPLPRRMPASISDEGEDALTKKEKETAAPKRRSIDRESPPRNERSPPKEIVKEASPPKEIFVAASPRRRTMDSEGSPPRRGSRDRRPSPRRATVDWEASPRSGSLERKPLPRHRGSDADSTPRNGTPYKEASPPQGGSIDKEPTPRKSSLDAEWKKVTPVAARKFTSPSHQPASSPSHTAPEDDVIVEPHKRPLLKHKGRQVSITSTISGLSIGSEDGFEESLSSQQVGRLPRQSSEESTTESTKSYNWRRKNAKRITTKGGGGGGREEGHDEFPDFPSPASTDEVEQPGAFRKRSGGGGGITRVSSGGSIGEQSAGLKKFQRSKSPLSMEGLPHSGSRGRAKSSSPSSHEEMVAAAAAARKNAQEKGKRQSMTSKSFDSRTHPDGTYGSIEVVMHLDEQDSELKVTVLRCNGLRAMDASGYSDPYVKLFLVPGSKRYNFRTRVINRSLNPEFTETFTFPAVTKSALEKKELCLVVMDRDEFTADDLIGSTRIKFYELLASRSLTQSTKMLLDDGRSMPFKGDKKEDKERGQIELAISYHAKQELLQLSVLRAKHLTPSDSSTDCDSYVKCLWSSQNQCAKKKTKVCPKTVHPEYQEDLEFQVKFQDLAYSKMVVTVWNKNRITKDHMVGEVQFSDPSFWKRFGKSSPTRVTSWYTVVEP